MGEKQRLQDKIQSLEKQINNQGLPNKGCSMHRNDVTRALTILRDYSEDKDVVNALNDCMAKIDKGSRPLPQLSYSHRVLIQNNKWADAVRLYRREHKVSLNEAYCVVREYRDWLYTHQGVIV